jgi:DNA polymerase III subunit epsilon
MILIFDTETTGLPKNYKAPATDTDNWPYLVEVSAILYNENGNIQEQMTEIVKPEGYTISEELTKIHGISNNYAIQYGKELIKVIQNFNELLDKAEIIVAHNLEFDMNILNSSAARIGIKENLFKDKGKYCTMKSTVDLCEIYKMAKVTGPQSRYRKFTKQLKYPKLEELYNKLFSKTMESAHTSYGDVSATAECYFELQKRIQGRITTYGLQKNVLPYLCSAQTEARAEIIAQQQTILIYPTDKGFHTEVESANPESTEIYSVDIIKLRDFIFFKCSCLYSGGGVCKHIAAMIMRMK